MKTYGKDGSKSGIEGYETGDDFITIKFRGASYIYTFTYESAGKVAVEVMKKMAEEGRGLSTFISTQVKDKFAKKTAVSGAEKTNFMNIDFTKPS